MFTTAGDLSRRKHGAIQSGVSAEIISTMANAAGTDNGLYSALRAKPDILAKLPSLDKPLVTKRESRIGPVTAGSRSNLAVFQQPGKVTSGATNGGTLSNFGSGKQASGNALTSQGLCISGRLPGSRPPLPSQCPGMPPVVPSFANRSKPGGAQVPSGKPSWLLFETASS
eukprot:TRINITY_DN4635_c0_g1_i1.p1 TRINITY_DN4635_c0_g1~~TRINITY_DN4635_c0_g1_i1.p1  ORF type:complete len:170 (+),score=12.68 TRINITY_DN4635_c0_g1_i1:173-682(+)